MQGSKKAEEEVSTAWKVIDSNMPVPDWRAPFVAVWYLSFRKMR